MCLPLIFFVIGRVSATNDRLSEHMNLELNEHCISRRNKMNIGHLLMFNWEISH